MTWDTPAAIKDCQERVVFVGFRSIEIAWCASVSTSRQLCIARSAEPLSFYETGQFFPAYLNCAVVLVS